MFYFINIHIFLIKKNIGGGGVEMGGVGVDGVFICECK